MPNTAVKPSSADGTARVTVWESRSLPGLFSGPGSLGFWALLLYDCMIFPHSDLGGISQHAASGYRSRGSWPRALWESRSLPGVFFEPRIVKVLGSFFCTAGRLGCLAGLLGDLRR